MSLKRWWGRYRLWRYECDACYAGWIGSPCKEFGPDHEFACPECPKWQALQGHGYERRAAREQFGL